jgi:cell division septum initiation protein DivIVA
MNYDDAVQIIEKLSVENKRLKRRIEELESQRISTRRGRRSIINDEMIQKTHQFRKEGLSIREIAYELGVSSYTAHKILHLNASVSETNDSIIH